MSESKQTETAPPQAADPAPLPTPSPTFYSEMAKELSLAVKRVTDSIPEFENPVVQKEFVERKRHVTAAFIAYAVNTLLTSDEVQNIQAVKAAQTVDDKRFVDAFESLAQYLESVLKSLKIVIRARKARLSSSAQQIYDFTKALVRDNDAKSLVKNVENMKRALRPSSRPRTPELTVKKEVPDTSSKP